MVGVVEAGGGGEGGAVDGGEGLEVGEAGGGVWAGGWGEGAVEGRGLEGLELRAQGEGGQGGAGGDLGGLVR